MMIERFVEAGDNVVIRKEICAGIWKHYANGNCAYIAQWIPAPEGKNWQEQKKSYDGQSKREINNTVKCDAT